MRYEITTRVQEEQPTAVVRGRVPVAQVGEWLSGAYGAVFGYLERTGTPPAGPPFACYVPVDGEFDVEAGAPVPAPVEGDGRVEPSSLPGGPVATTLHVGPYDAVAAAYDAVSDWLAEHGCAAAAPPWEVYLSEPDVPPEQIRTEVVEPYRET